MPAPWAYFDTSVLLKRYLAVSGTPEARRLLRRYRVVSAAISRCKEWGLRPIAGIVSGHVF